MKKRWYKYNMIYILWGIGLLVYLVFMADRYCEMFYGGNFLYVLTGQNQITEAEQEYLRQRGTLTYAETLDAFPAQLYDESLQGEKGFNIDLMDQLSLEMGTPIRFLPTEWPEVFNTLESGQADFIQISYSPERDGRYFLTEALYQNQGVVLLRSEGERIQTLEELNGMKIAGIRRDYAMEVLKEKVPGIEIEEYDSIEECAEVLISGRADGMVSDEQNMMYYVQRENMLQDYYILEEEVYTAGVVFAVPKSEEELGKIMNKVVYQLRGSGILDQLQRKWFLQSVLQPVVSEREQMFWMLKCFFGAVLFFVLLFFCIQARTNALVEDRTRELDQERKRLQVIVQSIPHHLFEVNSGGELRMVDQGASLQRSGREKQQLGEREIDFLKNLDWKKMLRKSEEQGYAQEDFQIAFRWYRVYYRRYSGGRHLRRCSYAGGRYHLVSYAVKTEYSEQQDGSHRTAGVRGFS